MWNKNPKDLLLVLAFFLHCHHQVCARKTRELLILDTLLKGSDYDRRAMPATYYNKSIPTTVECELFIRSMSSPNPLTMDYKTDLYLILQWTDPRLKHDELTKTLDLHDPDLVRAIWKPDMYFPNAKEADWHTVTVPNVLVRINPGGNILYMVRVKVTFSCMMDLTKFPLDRQVCGIEMASFAKTTDEIRLIWKDQKAVKMAKSSGLSIFVHVDTVLKGCNEEDSLPTGNYSCIVADFHLARSMGFHLVQSYLPTILMVIISWVSFWMDVNSVPGRVTLGVTTLLTVSSKATNIQGTLPESSYIKAIDVWMGTCTAFVFLALLEFTVVNYLWRNHFSKARSHHHKNSKSGEGGKWNDANGMTTVTARNKALMQAAKDLNVEFHEQEDGTITNHVEPIIVHSGSHTVIYDNSMIEKLAIRDPQAMARGIDETCRYCFPLAFAFFNCLYWPYYCL